ncbi:MAG: hypothetical protein LBJ95_03150 [Oscillospiraceae bacterium]|jgi:hypothetical protein|nr:hypothetical protein [Oscillospiraceae bacterium]
MKRHAENAHNAKINIPQLLPDDSLIEVVGGLAEPALTFSWDDGYSVTFLSKNLVASETGQAISYTSECQTCGQTFAYSRNPWYDNPLWYDAEHEHKQILSAHAAYHQSSYTSQIF